MERKSLKEYSVVFLLEGEKFKSSKSAFEDFMFVFMFVFTFDFMFVF